MRLGQAGDGPLQRALASLAGVEAIGLAAAGDLHRRGRAAKALAVDLEHQAGRQQVADGPGLLEFAGAGRVQAGGDGIVRPPAPDWAGGVHQRPQLLVGEALQLAVHAEHPQQVHHRPSLALAAMGLSGRQRQTGPVVSINGRSCWLVKLSNWPFMPNTRSRSTTGASFLEAVTKG